MTVEEARKLYEGDNGVHTAFESEFKALCDKYRVQAVAFYSGFEGLVAVGRVVSRQQLCVICNQVISACRRATHKSGASPLFSLT